MSLAWFITQYKRGDPFPGRPGRVCAMNDYTPQIYSAGGAWSETEVLGGYALVKVRAPEDVLATVAADPLFLRIPINNLNLLLSNITPQQRAAIQNRVEAMGYTVQEIQEALGNNLANVTLGDVLRFAASRRRRARFDGVQQIFVYDGIIHACRSIESVDAEIQE